MKAKQVLGCVLSAAMVTSCLPGTAFAAGAAKEPADGGKEAVNADDTAGKIVSETTGNKESGIATYGAVKDDGIVTYKVYLPDGYSEDMNYPSVYLMPYDGYSADTYINDGIAETLDAIMNGEDAIPMVVVMPEFTETQDYDALLGEVVADVEAKYSVIPDKQYRAILGVNVGGYMAYENTLIAKSDLFYGVGSHMGDFTSEANPYLEKGSIAGVIPSRRDANFFTENNHYYYLDAPNGDDRTTAANGTTTIGNNLVTQSGKNNEKAEYAVLPGKKNADYYQKYLSRSLNRFSKKFTESLYTADFVCEPSVVTLDDDKMTATVKFTATDALTNYTDSIPEVKVTVQMTDPNNGDQVLAEETKTLKNVVPGKEQTTEITLNRADMADGINTGLSAYVTFMGMAHQIEDMSLVSVQPTGTADDEQLIDLMGNWYFKAYKAYRAPEEDLDKIASIVPGEYENWGVVHPALGWWTADFDASLGGNANYAGYAWYVRTFEIPADFPKDGLLCPVGYFDESNEVYINGHLVGSTGVNFDENGVGTYDGSNPWDVNCVYNLDSSILNYGGENTIAIRTCNSSGGGGWYDGPVGIYSKAAYNKAAGKPSVYAPEEIEGAVKDAVAVQAEALAQEDIGSYKATISPDYFESGYTKDRRVSEAQSWFEEYDNIKVTDSGVGVFVSDDLYVYQADRVITGEKDGVTEEIYNDPEYLEYFKVTDQGMMMYGSHSRFFVDSTKSVAQTNKPEVTYRVYLPEGYFDEGNAERYQTLYLFHGINSQSMTYAIDKIDQVLDEAIRAGKLDKMIVVIPDDPTPSKMCWWKNAYEIMITEEVLPDVDARYRTINDARYRMTAGCSMGGGGAANIGLFNPTLFSGVVSFYGALNYVGGITTGAQAATSDYLDQFTIYMACGNQDVYSFYNVQEQMSAILTEKGIKHYHEVDNGGHDNIFYLPRFVPALQYLDAGMYHTDDSADIISGTADTSLENDRLNVTYQAAVSEEIAKYKNTVIDLKKDVERNEETGAVTKVTNNLGAENETAVTPDLNIPIEVVVTQNGVKVADVTDYQTAGEATTLTNTISIPTDDIDLSAEYTVSVYATVLENTVCIASTTVSSYQTGIYNVDGEDVYYVDGQRQYITDVVQVGDAWYNLVNGVVQKQVTVAGNAYGWWYINEDGIVDFSYTGLAPNAYGWWYVENGAVTFAANGLVYDSKYGWWYVEGSAINFGYTGLVQNAYGWWYVEGGAINFQATGLVQNAYGWWYVENGSINFNYNSLAPNAYGWWKITGGQVDFGFTGYVNYYGVNYRVVNGQVQF